MSVYDSGGAGGGSDANTKLNLISNLATEEFSGLIYIWSQFILISLFSICSYEIKY